MDFERTRPSLPRRKYIRLRGHDYSEPAAYFVTICTGDRVSWLGDVVEGEMMLSNAGKIAESQWLFLAQRSPDIDLDEHVVMPNHVHGILVLGAGPTKGRRPAELWEALRAFKAATSTLVRKGGDGRFGWQRGYYDRVVRGERELQKIREYIRGNPGLWELDRENPNNVGRMAAHVTSGWPQDSDSEGHGSRRPVAE